MTPKPGVPHSHAGPRECHGVTAGELTGRHLAHTGLTHSSGLPWLGSSSPQVPVDGLGLEVEGLPACLPQGLTQPLLARAVMVTSVRWRGRWSLSSRDITWKPCWRARSLPTSGKPSEAGPPIPATRGNRITGECVYLEEELRPGGGWPHRQLER